MVKQVISRVRSVLLWLLVAVAVAGWEPVLSRYFFQQDLHRIQIQLLRTAELEHQYFIEHGQYATQTQLQQRYPDWQTQTPEAVLSLSSVDRSTFLIVADAKQVHSNHFCQKITLNHSGRWCAFGECDSDCWQFK